MKTASIEAVFGFRGAGKTTLVQRRAAGLRRVVVFDVTGEYSRDFGFAKFDNIDLLAGWFRANRFGPIRAAYTPAGRVDHIAALSELARLLWVVQDPYYRGQVQSEITLIAEELNLGYPPNPPRKHGWFTQAVLQGRHAGISIIGVSQRPALVSPNFRGNAERWFVFPLGYEQDRAEVVSRIGREHAGTLRNLKKHNFIVYEDGNIRLGKNRKMAA